MTNEGIEVRLGRLETSVVGLREEVTGLREEMTARFDQVPTREEMKARFEQVPTREEMKAEGALTRAHFDAVYEKFRTEIRVMGDGYADLRERVARLEAKSS